MSPEIVVGLVTLTALAMFGCWRLARWFFEGKAGPNPWDEETERGIHQTDGVPLCTRGLKPHPTESRFCPNCGVPVDALVPFSPYFYVFAFGDTLRAATTRAFQICWIARFYFLRNLVKQRTEPVATSPETEDSRDPGT